MPDKDGVLESGSIDARRSFDTKPFRRALGRFVTGVIIVTAQHEGETRGMTANTFISVSLDPPLVLVSVVNSATMHRLLQHTNRYGVSVLSEDQEILSSHFAGRPVDIPQTRFIERQGVPLLDGAVAYFVAEVVDAHPAGDHTLYIGRVEYFETRKGRPLLFHGGRYDRLSREGS